MLYIVRYIIEMKTPLHCGSGDKEGVFDAPVVRDAFGYWKIPGTSLAGCLRSWFKTYKGEERTNAFFGYEETKASADSEGSSSLLWFSDAFLLDYDNEFAWERQYKTHTADAHEFSGFACIRDHVKIDVNKGTAVEGGKFDEEYVPAGTRFAFEISLNGVYKSLSPEDVEDFAFLLSGLSRCSFAAYAAKGYGDYIVLSQQGRHFDLTRAEDLNAWLNMPHTPTFAKDYWHEWKPQSCSAAYKDRDSIFGTITLPCVTSNPIIIGGGSSQSDADICFATTVVCDYTKKKMRDAYVIPGSSVRGVIRHRTEKIIKDLGLTNKTAIIDDLFGCIGEKVQRSKVRFFDAELRADGSSVDTMACQVVQHVSIDRITCGAMDGHLFSEAPLWQKDLNCTICVQVDDISPLEANILLHALFDLIEGSIALGAGGNRGNGFLYLNKEKGIDCSLTWNGEDFTGKNFSNFIGRISSAVL